MPTVLTPLYSSKDSASYLHRDSPSDDIRSALASTWQVLQQAPPPSLREILAAYNAKGDGDRDMLLAMLNAKTAEDQRLASIAALHRQMLELYNQSSPYPQLPQLHIPPSNNYPHHSQHHQQQPSSSVVYTRQSRSPSGSSLKDSSTATEPPRKRHRSSRSPPSAASNSASSHDLPPSPRSDSAEYSPRTRGSMAIGSLLSAAASAKSEEESSGYHALSSAERKTDRRGGIQLPQSSGAPLAV